MVAGLVFLVGQLFLFGTTSAQCGVACTPCKEFPDGDYEGTWNIKAEIDPRCPGRCLYQRNTDAVEMCFCDPGPIQYGTCLVKEWEGGLCYDDRYPPKLYDHVTELTDNSKENCNAYCSAQDENYTYFGMESFWNTNDGLLCYCGNMEPPTGTHEVVDPANCYDPCPGNHSQTCGASNFINVWAVVPYTVVAPVWDDGQCYLDMQPKLYDNVITLFDNSVENCRAYCGQGETYDYFGLEEYDCYCGNIKPPTEAHPLRPYNCWVACPGNPTQKCGAQNHINVWAL